MSFEPLGITRSEPPMPTGTIGDAALAATKAAPSNRGCTSGPALALTLGEQHERLAALEHGDAADQRLLVGDPRVTGKPPSADRNQRGNDFFHSESLPM